MQGILLIGMPGSGKSVVGRKLAETLGLKFFDGDVEIEKKYPDRQKFLDRYGDSEYVRMEGDVITKLPAEDSVLAPGGSMIYSGKARQYLKGCYKVFLDVQIETIRERLKNYDSRGIVYLGEKGLTALFRERKRLYKRYADIIVQCEGKSEDEIASVIAAAYSIKQLTTKRKAPLKYVSTNGKSRATFSEAMLLGLAPDKGLFIPTALSSFTKEEIKLMGNISYAQLAFALMRRFVNIDDASLERMCRDAYNFDIPLEHHNGLFISRLDRGPSASFKDFAAQLLAHMIEYAAKKRNRKLTILTATSGDTGGAVAAAFAKVKGIKVVILMPAREVTERQRRQMTTVGGNVRAVLVEGKFDDCQRLAKEAFIKIKGLSSANSINIGRLLPQIVYYFYIHCRTNANTFVVPSGNFGNLVAGVMAKRMGLPIKFVAAVNENDEFPKFLKTGKYVPIVPSKLCISNAMNVGNPSNLARLVWLYGGRMDETGKITKLPAMQKLREGILSVSITDKETRDAIRQAHKKGIVLEPHGAVGWAAIEKLKSKGALGTIVLFETAHPAKFPEELNALGVSYATPKNLARLNNLKENFITINPELEELRELIVTYK